MVFSNRSHFFPHRHCKSLKTNVPKPVVPEMSPALKASRSQDDQDDSWLDAKMLDDIYSSNILMLSDKVSDALLHPVHWF